MNEKMKIGLISFLINPSNKNSIFNHVNYFLKIVNDFDYLDVIIFSGWTLLKKDLEFVKKNIKNKNSLILFEVWDDFCNNKEQHKGYYFKEGVFYDKDIIQLFATSDEINRDKELMKRYLTEINNNRIIEFKNRKICWLICGEINVLKNVQKEQQRVLFRFDDDNNLKNEFYNIYNNINIFINPTHTIMGNQGKLARRREFLSKNNRLFCSISNADLSAKKQSLNAKSIQYFYLGGNSINGIDLIKNNEILFKEYKCDFTSE